MIKLTKTQQRILFTMYKDSILRNISIDDLISSGYYNNPSNKRLYENVQKELRKFIRVFETSIIKELTIEIENIK
ncbi:hypothetical protein AN161_18350 [Lysinibacillus sp. FJAT-14222]|nr:hypothetical protein AN161_18350 [Lysinibacillus sp. FJAT-14222]